MRKLIASSFVTLLVASAGYASCPKATDSQGKDKIVDLGTILGKTACELSGRFTSDDFASGLELTSDKHWVLRGGVFIGNDNNKNSQVTIQPGTKIFGKTGADYLVITRGSKIMAEGTQSEPIVFTTINQSNRRRGEWGGLIINGNAPINGCPTAPCEAEGEGSTGKYGGSDANDNSGVLKYVRVEFAGYEISPENELNGIAFQGVGAGTTVDYIQVHMNADDGVEFFGGTVNARHVVLTGNRDDSLDWVQGWRGNAQHVVVQQYSDAGDNGIEADNLKSPMDSKPRSLPTLANMTFVGNPNGKGAGMLLRRGTGAHIHNTIVTGFHRSCIDFDDQETFRHAMRGDDGKPGLTMSNSIVYCPASKHFTPVEPNKDGSMELFPISFWFQAQPGNQVADPKLSGYLPQSDSPVWNLRSALSGWFDQVSHIGAIGQTDWTSGWTIHDRQ